MRLLAPLLSTHEQYKLHERKHCCARNNNILDAASSIQDIVAHAEFTHQAICLLSLKFSSILTVYLMTSSTISFVSAVSMKTQSPCLKAYTLTLHRLVKYMVRCQLLSG
jgi:hypothetical protein